MIKVENLTLAYKKEILVDKISFRVEEGELVSLVGESGSGKTLIAHSILGCISPKLKKSGKIEVIGTKGYIPQHNSYLNPLLKIGRQVGYVDKRELEHFGLSKTILDSYPHQLSGGMLKRLAFVLALSEVTDIIIADEPTDGVDEEGAELIFSKLRKLKGKTLLVITHDLELAKKYSDRIIYMKDARLANLDYIKKLEENEPEIYFRKYTIPRRRVPEMNENLSIKKLTFSYIGGKNIFRDFDFECYLGEVVGIVGKSGSGKTTLAKIITGRLFRQKSFDRVKNFYIAQNPEQAFNPKRRLALIMKENKNISKELIKALDIDESWFFKYPSELSGGQLQRLAILRAIGEGVRYIVADEITSKLDNINQIKILEVLIKMCRRRDIGLILISHNRNLIENICDRIYEVGND